MDPRGDTRTLIERARAGDRQAFDEIIGSFRPRIEALIRARLGKALSRDVHRDDVLQETLLRAFRSIERFRSEDEDGESFLRWLGGIAEHVILTFARRPPRGKELPLEGEVPAEADGGTRIGIRAKHRFRENATSAPLSSFK